MKSSMYEKEVAGLSDKEKRKKLNQIYEKKRCLPYILGGLILGKDVFM